MRLAALILAAAACLAQTTRYPGALDSDSSLFVVQDNVQTTLSAAMGIGDTAAVVASATGFVPNMVATICDTTTNTGKCTAWEHMLVTAVTGNVLTVTRGQAGTTARTHSSGRLVSILIDSVHQKVLKDAVVAVQTALGPNLSNISGSASGYISSKFLFSPYSCNASSVCAQGGASGMSLIAGNNSLTLTPVPNGINGSDSVHFLYVSGGTGTAEACLITGGSGQSGQASGQIILNCPNTHSGAWTLESTAGGIPEALQASKTGGVGGAVIIPPGTVNVRSFITIPSNTTLIGSGRGSTILFVPTNSFVNVIGWRGYGFNPSGNVLTGPVGGANMTIKSLTISFGAQATPPNGSYGIEFVNATGVLVEDTEVLNGPVLVAGNTFLPYGFNGTTSNSILRGNYVNNRVCTVSGEGAGGFMVGGSGNRIVENYVGNGCNGPFVGGGNDLVFANNTFELLGSTQAAGSQAFSSDNGSRNLFVGNRCTGNGTGPNCFSVTTDAASPPSVNNTFVGNVATNCGEGYQIKPLSAFISGVHIYGGSVQGCVTPLATSGSFEDFTIRSVAGITTGESNSTGYPGCNGLPLLASGANQNVVINNFGNLRTSGCGGPATAFSIGGIQGGFDGRELTIVNNSGQTLTLNNQDAGSVAKNRIFTGTGGNLVITRGVVSLLYSIVDSIWFVKSTN